MALDVISGIDLAAAGRASEVASRAGQSGRGAVTSPWVAKCSTRYWSRLSLACSSAASLNAAPVTRRLLAGPKRASATRNSAAEIGACHMAIGQSHSSATAAIGLDSATSFSPSPR